MSTDGVNYSVVIEKYAERHYIKGFSRKYRGAWDATFMALTEQFRRIDRVVGVVETTNRIHVCDSKYIAKHDFKIAATNDSAKTSGDRAIILVDEELRECRVLLVYSKNDICSPNETQKWETEVRDNYPEIWGMFKQK